jgi:chromosome segregation ATPase
MFALHFHFDMRVYARVCQATLSETACEMENLRTQLTEASEARAQAINSCATAEEATRTALAQSEALSEKLAAAEATAAKFQDRAECSGETTTALELKIVAAEKARDEARAAAEHAEKMLVDVQRQAAEAAAGAAEREAKTVELEARLDVALRAEEESAAQLIKLRERGAHAIATYYESQRAALSFFPSSTSTTFGLHV